jgi:hypothetical protein
VRGKNSAGDTGIELGKDFIDSVTGRNCKNQGWEEERRW